LITNDADASYDFSAQTEALIIQGGGADDTLIGTQDWDDIEGGAGNDTLTGGAGSDTLRVLSGSDTVTDLVTGDRLQVASGATATAIEVADFVATSDTDNAGSAILNARATGSLIDLGLEGATGTAGYQIHGGLGVDVVTGSRHDDTISGGAESDRLLGGGGADLFVLAEGDHTAVETVMGGDGVDVIRFTSTAAGTLTLSSQTLIALWREIGAGVARSDDVTTDLALTVALTKQLDAAWAAGLKAAAGCDWAFDTTSAVNAANALTTLNNKELIEIGL
jgi:Ca2+-binding RTX toxin-like protein